MGLDVPAASCRGNPGPLPRRACPWLLSRTTAHDKNGSVNGLILVKLRKLSILRKEPCHRFVSLPFDAVEVPANHLPVLPKALPSAPGHMRRPAFARPRPVLCPLPTVYL